jgi:hypothetical protein
MWVIQSEVGLVRYFWVPNFGDVYIIGDDGSLWSRYKRIGWSWYLSNDWFQRRLSPDSDGYLGASLSFNGVKYRKQIHQLVCEAVWGPCPVGLEVCHNDGSIFNNWHWNLRYDTPKGNSADRVKHGTDMRGEKHPNAILNWTRVREIRAKYHSGKYTQVALALEYHVTDRCIWRIVNNLTWIEIEGEILL